MSRLNRFMLVTIYAIAAATMAVGLMVLGTLKGMEPWFAGALAFLVLSQLHAAMSHGAERKRVSKSFADLNSFITGLSRDLERSENELEALNERFETEGLAHSDDVVSEMRVIKSFVKKLAEEQQPAKIASGS